jgi:AcrR family transcriptional regulator
MSAEEQAKKKSDLVKREFIDAANAIILRDGVLAVTVRKVAQAAGYSYATIYHYFKDLDSLLIAVKERMVEDVMIHMTSAETPSFRDVADIQRMNRMYAQFYLGNPNIYEFFYTYRFSHETNPNYDMRFQDGWALAYETFVKNGVLRKEDVATVAKTVIYTIHGLLALYFSSNGLTKEALFQDMDDIVEVLFQRRGTK